MSDVRALFDLTGMTALIMGAFQRSGALAHVETGRAKAKAVIQIKWQGPGKAKR